MADAIVLKFGGASLKTLEHFERVADIILDRKQSYQKVLVVVSAMQGVTDQLLALSEKVHFDPPKREQDMLLSVGERMSMALLAMVLHQRGQHAISFTGSQAGIITTNDHLDAKIIEVRPHRVLPHLDANEIVIIAGFQGVSLEKEVTTLGRGGSDTTAVALAIALKARKVEFYKDVEGIYACDPKSDPSAMHLPRLSYEEAHKVIVDSGSKVLHPRALILAGLNHVPLVVKSFLDREKAGSVIVSDDDELRPEPVFEALETKAV